MRIGQDLTPSRADANRSREGRPGACRRARLPSAAEVRGQNRDLEAPNERAWSGGRMQRAPRPISRPADAGNVFRCCGLRSQSSSVCRALGPARHSRGSSTTPGSRPSFVGAG